MRKFTKLMLTLALLVVGVGGAKAVKTLGTEFTSVSALSGKTFAIINKADNKAICHKQKNAPYDLQYLEYAEAFSASNFGYTFQLELTEGGYLIRCVDPSGSLYSNDYLQSNSSKSGACFIYAKNFSGTNRGLDGDGYAVWVIEYVTDEGFTLKNLATENYINDPTKAAYSDTPKYFTFCELDELTTTVSINNVSITETLASNPEHFTEITQENVEGSFTHADKEEKDGYTEYTANGDLNIAIKTTDISVTGCDFIIIKFYEAITQGGWNVAFWGDNSTESVKEGDTEYKLIFAEDPLKGHPTAFNGSGNLKEITMMTLWGGDYPRTAKVKGIYKHTAIDYNRTYSFEQALDFTDTGLEAYVITAFNPETATLTLSRVYQVPANTGLYLVGKGGDYEIPVIDSAGPIATNLLHASSGTVALELTESSNTNLIFGGSGENRGFHPLSEAGIIGANKAYLQIPTAQFNSIPSGARLNIVFEDGTTAIKTLNEVKVVDNAWYTVNGVKLNAKPTQKGIYINNGKKYAIK